jgi:hypothetical protein
VEIYFLKYNISSRARGHRYRACIGLESLCRHIVIYVGIHFEFVQGHKLFLAPVSLAVRV